MRKVGLDIEELELKLDAQISNDCDFNSGFILGSMCTEPLEFTREIYARYLHINVGDKGISPCTAKIEKKLISETPSKILEIIIANSDDNRAVFEKKVLSRQKQLIKKHGKAEFERGVFLILRPANWKSN